MEHTGLLVAPPRPEDYILGAETAIAYEERLASGNWSLFLPEGEKQSRPTFDTLSCTTFSALNDIETQINWFVQESGKVPLGTIDFLEKEGYLKGEVVNFSDRFTAIMSGTTKNGNYLVNVMDSIRKDGVIPEVDFPFDGATWDEYHDKSNVTEEMKKKAKKILDHFKFQYEWVAYDGVAGFTPFETETTKKCLLQAPLQVGVPIPATHAVMMYYMNGKGYGRFDHYTPFQRDEKLTKAVQFALRIIVTLKEPDPLPEKPAHVFNREMSFGMRSSEVQWLQKVLIFEGLMKKGLDTGYFGEITKKAVIAFQEKHADKILTPLGLTQGTGNVKFWTLKYLNEQYS